MSMSDACPPAIRCADRTFCPQGCKEAGSREDPGHRPERHPNDRTPPHRCDVPNCDGTLLGHDLAVEFPEETRQIDEALDHLRDRPSRPGTEGGA